MLVSTQRTYRRQIFLVATLVGFVLGWRAWADDESDVHDFEGKVHVLHVASFSPEVIIGSHLADSIIVETCNPPSQKGPSETICQFTYTSDFNSENFYLLRMRTKPAATAADQKAVTIDNVTEVMEDSYALAKLHGEIHIHSNKYRTPEEVANLMQGFTLTFIVVNQK